MKRLKRRTIIALILAAALAAGMLFFLLQLALKGSDWVGFFAAQYYNAGAIYDRDGTLLYNGETGEYAENQTTRVATLHLVGDQNFGTSLRSVLADRLTGYNFVTGTSLGSHDVSLTVDADLNATAYAALNGHRGVVAVYDYTTGDVLCLVSSPSYDPENPPSNINDNPAYEGVYLNRFFSSTFPPGSVFKLVTTAAAIEEKKDLADFRYTCTGSLEVEGDVITCPYAHGTDMDINQCLATSCNGAYATLAMELGGRTLGDYTDQAGLLDSLNVNGISTAAGSFVAEPDGSAYLGWSGVGQDKDLVNPCSLLAFMGSIANEGEAVVPNLVGSETIRGTAIPAALPAGKDTYETYSPETCQRLKEMMRNNVVSQYGQSQFGELAVCAKSGTAEVGGGAEPHAWFAGFIDDADHPLAFVVLVENGSAGARVAGSVAAQVLAQATAD
ncbi:penicillin-binding transpeptidase domain-containing protein [Evtepia sp.]|nr:penicillin-binding protein [Candidatus Evtepia faecavium]